jgi:hypothetical protein
LGGDVNADAKIDILDIAYIGARFEGQDALADLNQDGQVNILDLVLAATNYGQTLRQQGTQAFPPTRPR